MSLTTHRPLRTLFVKQSLDPFGPWQRSDWVTDGASGLLEKFAFKVTLWEMSCALQADWRIIPANDSDFAAYVRSLDRAKRLLDEYQVQIDSLASIDFSRYDIVISLEACIPESIIESYKDTLFFYYKNEHSNHIYQDHLTSPVPGYTKFLDHMCGSVDRETAPPSRALHMPYLRTPSLVRDLFPRPAIRRERPRVWIEARTIMACAAGSPWTLWNDDCDEYLRAISRRFNIEAVCRSETYKGFYNIQTPHTGEPAAYLSALASADIFVGLQAAGAGQALCDAASLQLPSFGTPRLVYHRMTCDPATLMEDLDDALERAVALWDEPKGFTEICQQQDRNLVSRMHDEPIAALKSLAQA